MFDFSLMPKRKRYGLLIYVLFGVAGLSYLYFADPMQGKFYPPCMFYKFSHLYCPGCGAARCLHALAHGNLQQALAYNALLVLCLPYIVACGLDYAYREWRGRRWRNWMLPAWTIWLWLGITIAYWILRNIPVSPFSLLAPHQL